MFTYSTQHHTREQQTTSSNINNQNHSTLNVNNIKILSQVKTGTSDPVGQVSNPLPHR